MEEVDLEVIEIDIKRMQLSLEGQPILIPSGLNREELRNFILTNKREYSNE